MPTAVTSKAPTAAAIYARISQDRTGAGLGVARQETDCRAWAEKNGWTVVAVYTDDDLSAYKRRKPRPGYLRLVEAIRSGEHDGLIAWHPDRLHRRNAELEPFIEVVEGTGLTFGMVMAGHFDLNTANGRLLARITGAVDEHESDHKSERIRRKHLELAQNGKVPGGGIRPFGYEADRVTVRESEADLIREAAERVLAGDGLRTICNDWTSRGVATVTGAQWQGVTLRRLLRSGRIIGWREHHGQLVAEAEWPAIIDPETGRRLRRLLDDPARNKYDTTSHKYLLSGMVVCGNCGGKVVMVARPVMRKGHRYRRYGCVTDKGGCNSCGIGAEPLEDLITEAVFIRLDTPALAKAVARRKSKPKKGIHFDDVPIIEARMSELAEMYAAGELNRAEWSTARAGLTERLDEARKVEAQSIRDEAAVEPLRQPDVLRREWPSLSLEKKRKVLGTIIDHITIAPTSKANNKFDPDRVDVTWKI